MAKKRILVLDFYTSFLTLMELLLTDEGYEVVTVLDGDLNHSYQQILKERPDLVIVDLVTVNRDETETLLTMLQLDPKLKEIPVIVNSADVRLLKRKQERLESLGYRILEKPFEMSDLLAVIEDILGG